MSTPEGLLEPQLLTPITPTPPLLPQNANGNGDYFKQLSSPHIKMDALEQGLPTEMMEKAMESAAEMLASSEKAAPHKNINDNDADLLFKIDMDE